LLKYGSVEIEAKGIGIEHIHSFLAVFRPILDKGKEILTFEQGRW
jgi:hypothetical protein